MRQDLRLWRRLLQGSFTGLPTVVGLLAGVSAAAAEEAGDARVAEAWYRAAIDGCLANTEKGETIEAALPGYRMARADGGLLASPTGLGQVFYVLHRGDLHNRNDADGVYRMYCNVRSIGPASGEMDHVLQAWATEAVEGGRYASVEQGAADFAMVSTFRTPRGCLLSVTYGEVTDDEKQFSVVEMADDGCGGAPINW